MRKLPAHFWKTMIVLTGVAVSLTSCSHRESPPPAATEEHHEGDPMEHNVGTKPMGAPPASDERKDWRYPYGEAYRDLAGADAKTVAETALKRFCSFTPKDLEDEKVVERLNGVVHPPLWDQITDDPDTVVPIVPGRTAGQWESTGGKTKVEIIISGEQHPADTDDSWSRKMICVRNWSGFSKPFKDLYLVVVTKKEDSWRLSRLELVESYISN